MTAMNQENIFDKKWVYIIYVLNKIYSTALVTYGIHTYPQSKPARNHIDVEFMQQILQHHRT